MDFTISQSLEELRQRIAAFVENEVLPLESVKSSYDDHENISLALLNELRAKARAEGLWCLQLPKEDGGLGVGRTGMAVCYEEMNRSIFGPAVFNSAAPDDGNMMVLSMMGTKEQKRQWLDPIGDGKVRSAFAMTEPHPGGGSDPSMIATKAVKDGEDYVISGTKWFITGAGEASHFILIARTSDDPRSGLTAFLFHKDQPGWEIERRIGIMGPEEHGGHCELIFNGLRVHESQILGGIGRGLKVTQTRLGPARLTHCMRWLGLAKRSVEIASDYAAKREGFGVRLADRESIQLMLGDLGMQIEIGRLLGDEGGLGDRSRRICAYRGFHGEDPRRQRASPGSRPSDPDQWRPRLFQGYGARMDLPLCPAGAFGRWRRRGPQDGYPIARWLAKVGISGLWRVDGAGDDLD